MILKNAIVSGVIAGAATAAAAALCGVANRSGAAAPVNATSHILWGDEAASASQPDARHTLPGLALHFGATIFWATLYEAVPRHPLGGAATAALAYVTDYHVVPRRLTPGWELRLPARSLALIYLVLAASLPLRGLLQQRKVS